jgi:ATP/ADP translocase
LTASLVHILGAANMLLVAAGLIAATLGIFLVLESNCQGISAERRSSNMQTADMNKVGGVIKTIFSNKLLLLLTCLVTFERVTPDLVQFLYNDVLKHMASGSNAIAALDANLERWRAIIEFFVELFLVSAVLKKFGNAFALTSNASVIFAGLITYALIPHPAILIAVFHLDEGCRHAWFKAAKELMYTLTPREVLYTVKPVIEMFFYRFARGIAGILIYVVNSLCHFGSTGVLLTGAAAAAVWFACAMQLSGEYKRLEGRESVEPATGDTSSSKKKQLVHS